MSLPNQAFKGQKMFDLRLSLKSKCGLLQCMSYNMVLHD